MGVLKLNQGDHHIALAARCLVGRHPRCDVQVEDPRASGVHASIYWVADQWELRDLGSSNGTYIDGRRIEPGKRARLASGSVIGLGSQRTSLVLTDAGPPMAVARHIEQGTIRTAEQGMIVLPDDDNPILSVFEDLSGNWVAEQGDTTRPVMDRDVLTVGDEAWQLQLPATIDATLQSASMGPNLDSIELCLSVSRDEEHVDAELVFRGERTAIPPRAYHYMLVTLARLRQKEVDNEPSERGWVHREDLCRMLAIDNNKLNVDIFRARKQLASLGVQGAASLIERRASGHVRIGLETVSIRAR